MKTEPKINYSEKLKNLRDRQADFQRMVGAPIDSKLEKDRNQLSETYVFKGMEEMVELRKTFPSALNPDEKNRATVEKETVLFEFCDVIHFLINLSIVWKFSFEEILESLEKVQDNNYAKIKAKKMAQLTDLILRQPNYKTGIGYGNLSPKYIFIGQNPGNSLPYHGYPTWSEPTVGSAKILLPILEELGIKIEDCYFTNVVKSVTEKNEIPSKGLTSFWLEFLNKEIELLTYGNSLFKVIPMGSFASKELGIKGIPHPAVVFHGTSRSDYKNMVAQYFGIDPFLKFEE